MRNTLVRYTVFSLALASVAAAQSDNQRTIQMKADLKKIELKEQAETIPALKEQYRSEAAALGLQLGQYYEHYRDSNHPDYEDAKQWYTYALMRRSVGVADSLGMLYWNGNGVPMDKERAKYLWLWGASNAKISGEFSAGNGCLFWLRKAGVDTTQQRKAMDDAIRKAEHQDEAVVGAAAILAFAALSRGSESMECGSYHLALLAGTVPFGYKPPANCK